MRSLLRRFFYEEDGQTATEYMLIIAVIVVGIVLAAKIFLDKFSEGMKDMGSSIGEVFKDSSSKIKSLQD